MGNATPHDGNWYFTGDQPVDGHQITYLLPPTLFAMQAAAQDCKAEHIQLDQIRDPNVSQLEIVPANEELEDLELIVTGRGMWIPNSYAALCLEHGLSPVDVWKRVYGAILQDGHGTGCSPLIEFLQYQMLGTAGTNMAIFGHQDLVQPPISAEFLRH